MNKIKSIPASLLAHFKRHRTFYSYFIVLIFIVFFWLYALRHKESFRVLQTVSPKYLLGIALLVLLYKIIVGLKFKIMIDFFNVRLKVREWFGLSCLSTMMSSLFPARAGIFAQAVYLKNIHRFEYSKFATYLVNFACFSLIVYSLSGLFLLILHYLNQHIFYTAVFWIFLIIFFISSASFFLLPRLGRLKFRWRLLNTIVSRFQTFKGQRKLFRDLLLVQLLDIVITGLRLFLAYKSLGVKVSILPVLLVGIFASSSVFISLTPASLGVRELFITISSAIIGQEAVIGLMVSLIDRVIGTIVTVVAGLFFIKILLPSGKTN